MNALAMKSRPTTNQRREHVGYNSVAIFIRLAVVASEIGENLPKFELIAVQGHPRSLILVSDESAYATSYLSLIVTMDVSLTAFIYLENSLFFPTPPFLDAPS